MSRSIPLSAPCPLVTVGVTLETAEEDDLEDLEPLVPTKKQGGGGFQFILVYHGSSERWEEGGGTL